MASVTQLSKSQCVNVPPTTELKGWSPDIGHLITYGKSSCTLWKSLKVVGFLRVLSKLHPQRKLTWWVGINSNIEDQRFLQILRFLQINGAGGPKIPLEALWLCHTVYMQDLRSINGNHNNPNTTRTTTTIRPTMIFSLSLALKQERKETVIKELKH